jgi:chromosome segregation ATPase
VDRALSYQAQIDSVIKTSANKTEQPRLEQLRSQIDTWTKAIGDLAERLNSLRQDDVIRRDMREVPRAIADLETRLANETDTVVRSQLERTLDNRRKQLDSLEQLQTMMKRAEIQIESTLSQLGTIYSQLLTGQSTSHVADYSHLSADVDEEVRLLQDHLEALREVKLG